ncbi:hypothetical protein [Candidatus Methanoperedens nitratireducens]|uniref:Uncharacterized protein n=1 Tax=Candidatus Methanoperedens nitratireducens TaxID=1392998 RepID=A0A284VMQ9_9EURY|nr:hypothetical protein [Candidatus Methanoperedens nitroreducens]SNQ60544.1 hypothetical protein MNV_1870006 [Candidatus Methanoperedens nitroreducens]
MAKGYYSIGDIVRFKIGSDEIQLGEIRFIEKNHNETVLYINSFSGWAYKVSEKKIVAGPERTGLIQKLSKSYLTGDVGPYREGTLVSSPS